ncbi:MAG: ATP-grasp domain-containing protein [Pseudodesulfovibrio sp.]|nr:ATP-grasp domain-containing protein [Pseudodesulfovibrio sp.]
MNVLVEAVGSPMWGTLFPLLKQTFNATVGLDINTYSHGLYALDKGYLVPKYSSPDAVDAILDIATRERIDVFMPSLHEGLLMWSELSRELAQKGITVLISPPDTVRHFHDKWDTYRFFTDNKIPTPPTSLTPEYDLLKPRVGRGGAGIRPMEVGESFDPDIFISQKFLQGQEYSIDALCDLDGIILCVVVRKRLAVESGLSVTGIVVDDKEIESMARTLLGSAHFRGPVNMQCFRTDAGMFFTEVNPRLAGGMSLSMNATENWFMLIRKMLEGKKLVPMDVQHDLVMMRHYQDVFVDKRDLKC